jgi:dipeptidyl aminopeptidase/acylaminoacyl peptidase
LKPIGEEPFFVPNGLYVSNLVGPSAEGPLFELDRNISFYDYLSDGRVLVTANHGTKTGMWIGEYDGKFKEIDLHDIIVNDIHVGQRDELVFIGSRGNQPPELFYMETSDSKPEKISNFNQFVDDLKLGKVSSITWETDGFQADGVLIYPPDYVDNQQYPLLLYIHGGPMSASLTSFDFYAQAMAAEGWIIFRPNYRGSNNLGKDYQRAVVNDAGAGPGRDVMAGIDKLKAMGIIDVDRMAVSGWSYGGFMTVWLTSHYQVWKAAVAGASVTDWFDWYNLADMNRWSGYGLGGSPWLNDNAQNYWKQSPISYAHQIQTPTLILHNTKDPRVTVTQSFKLFYNLKDRGVETKFIAYPLPGHFPQDPVHRLDVYKRWIQWIKERL